MAGVAEPVDETLGTVRAVDLARGHPPDGLEQFVVVGVVGERQGMVHSETVPGRVVGGPAGHGDADFAFELIESRGAGRNDHDPAGLDLAGEPFVIERGDVAKGFEEADYIFENTYRTGRPVPCYMEPNACLCHFDTAGKLTIYASTQCAFMVRGILSEVLGIPYSDVRVIVEHMGGGFGAKQDLYQHEFVCAHKARTQR